MNWQELSRMSSYGYQWTLCWLDAHLVMNGAQRLICLTGAIPLSRHRQEHSRKENVPLLSEPDLFCRYMDAWSLQSAECLAPLTNIKYA